MSHFGGLRSPAFGLIGNPAVAELCRQFGTLAAVPQFGTPATQANLRRLREFLGMN